MEHFGNLLPHIPATTPTHYHPYLLQQLLPTCYNPYPYPLPPLPHPLPATTPTPTAYPLPPTCYHPYRLPPAIPTHYHPHLLPPLPLASTHYHPLSPTIPKPATTHWIHLHLHICLHIVVMYKLNIDHCYVYTLPIG